MLGKYILIIFIIFLSINCIHQYNKAKIVAQEVKQKIYQDIRKNFNLSIPLNEQKSNNNALMNRYLLNNQTNDNYIGNNMETINKKIQQLIKGYKKFNNESKFNYFEQTIKFSNDSKPQQLNLTRSQIFIFRMFQTIQKWQWVNQNSNKNQQNNKQIHFKIYDLTECALSQEEQELGKLGKALYIVKNMTQYLKKYNVGPLYWYQSYQNKYKAVMEKNNNTIVKNFILFNSNLSVSVNSTTVKRFVDILKGSRPLTNNLAPISKTKTVRINSAKSVLNSTKSVPINSAKSVLNSTKPVRINSAKSVLNSTKSVRINSAKSVLNSTKSVRINSAKSVLNSTKSVPINSAKSVLNSTKSVPINSAKSVLNSTKSVPKGRKTLKASPKYSNKTKIVKNKMN